MFSKVEGKLWIARPTYVLQVTPHPGVTIKRLQTPLGGPDRLADDVTGVRDAGMILKFLRCAILSEECRRSSNHHQYRCDPRFGQEFHLDLKETEDSRESEPGDRVTRRKLNVRIGTGLEVSKLGQTGKDQP